MRELFAFCTSKTNFIFNGVVYDQIDGCAMGSPLAPILANLFLGHYEKIWLDEYNANGGGGGPLFYRRYVDDIFAVFKNQNEASEFLLYLNCKHGNIKFTMEVNVDGILNFLDVKIENKDRIKTSVFHKPTFTGLMTNFRSFVPYEFKTKLVNTLVDRIFKINNSWKGFHENVVTLKNYLSRNLFPNKIVEKNLKKYLDKKMLGTKNVENTQQIHFFKLPYIGEFSNTVKNRINSLHKRFCKTDKRIQIVFSVSKIRDYFSTKDPIPECFRSFVVYQFTCANCGIRYVGRTHKHFNSRIKEHFGSGSSSIYQHLNHPKNSACKITSTIENSFKILDNARTDYELALKEGFYINWLKPALNKQKIHEVITLTI